jgi:hypothetical protein
MKSSTLSPAVRKRGPPYTSWLMATARGRLPSRKARPIAGWKNAEELPIDGAGRNGSVGGGARDLNGRLESAG